MANAYVNPNFDIDTDTNIAGLTALKGSAPAATDLIYIYNAAVLTVESALSILLISFGETSGGAAPAGQRRGDVTGDAGVSVTFAGSATQANSGIKSNPASAAAESKDNTLTVPGTSGSPIIFTNSVGGYNANNRWQFNFVYGQFVGWDYVELRYGCGNGEKQILYPGTANTTATTHAFDHTTFISGDSGDWSVYEGWYVGSSFTANVDVNYGRVLVDNSGGTQNRIFQLNPLGGDMTAGKIHYLTSVEGIPAAGKTIIIEPVDARAGATIYGGSIRWSFADIRLTEVVPTGLALTDDGSGEALRATITNIASYANADLLFFYDDDDDALLAVCTKAQYVAAEEQKPANSCVIAGLTNANLYTIYAKASSDGYIFSDASGTATGTPGGAPAPSVPDLIASYNEDNDSFNATFDGDAGVTNHLVYKPKDNVGWNSGGSRAGDGSITIASGPGVYELYGYSEDTVNATFSDPTDVIEVTVAPAGIPDSPVGYKRWNWYRYSRTSHVWTYEGNFPAPVQETPIVDGRVGGMTVGENVEGGKFVLFNPQRSRLKSLRLRWFREKSGGGSSAIYHKINEWVKTGAELKVETHIDGLEYQGAFHGSPRRLPRSPTASNQDYEPTAVFECYAVDGTGTGW